MKIFFKKFSEPDGKWIDVSGTITEFVIMSNPATEVNGDLLPEDDDRPDAYYDLYSSLIFQYPLIEEQLNKLLIPEQVYEGIPELPPNYFGMPERYGEFDPEKPTCMALCSRNHRNVWFSEGDVSHNTHLRVSDFIFHLNDDHHMSREEIADRLDKLHDDGIIDLTIISNNPDRA